MHSSMDKPAKQLRPYCTKHDKFFRTWAGAYVHKTKDCVLISKYITTR